MGIQWKRDRYHDRAMKEGYRSRAAFKLLELQRRFRFIRDSDNIIDLGAAPGSWMQVERELTQGTVLGVDLNPIAPIENTLSVVGDFTSTYVQEQIRSLVPEVSVVVCDASPKLSGHKSYDQARAMALAEEALIFARRVLKKGGNFAIKTFQGDLFDDFLRHVKEQFHSVHVFRTAASRKGSTEIYIIAKNFRGVENGNQGSV